MLSAQAYDTVSLRSVPFITSSSTSSVPNPGQRYEHKQVGLNTAGVCNTSYYMFGEPCDDTRLLPHQILAVSHEHKTDCLHTNRGVETIVLRVFIICVFCIGQSAHTQSTPLCSCGVLILCST